MSSKIKQIIYAIFALIGVIVTWYFNLKLILAPGDFKLSAFIADNYINAASASITNDLLVVSAVFLFWSFVESRRLSMKNWWVFIPLTFGVAIAFSYPLFLLLRERKLAKSEG